MLSAAQVRAGRSLLDWRQVDLAEAAGVSIMAVRNLEDGSADTRMSTMRAIIKAFDDAGVIFLAEGENRDGGAGVRFKG